MFSIDKGREQVDSDIKPNKLEAESDFEPASLGS